MMKAKITVLISLFFISSGVFAQQLFAPSTFLSELNKENPSLINRNYLKHALPYSVDFNYHHQWAGLKGAPRTGSLSISYFDKAQNFLIGGTLNSDRTFPSSQFKAGINGAYRIKLSYDSYILAGIGLGASHLGISAKDLDLLEDETINSADLSKLYLNLDAGLSIVLANKYFLGISSNQLNQNSLQFKSSSATYNYMNQRHYAMQMGAVLQDHNKNWIEPALNIKYLPGLAILLESSLKYEMRDQFWFSIGAATSKKVNIGAGFIILGQGVNRHKHTEIGYAYSHYFGELGINLGGVHEIRISYSK